MQVFAVKSLSSNGFAAVLQWELRQAWAPLLIADEEVVTARWERDPVKPAQPAPSAARKKRTRQTESGLPVQSFRSLLMHLGTQTRNDCRVEGAPAAATFAQVSAATPLQAEAYRCLGL